MEALKKKWHSCQGASILLALLFLLVSMMVGASVVMAAASNAGKIKSNKEEQQKYLTLSSALNFVVDELVSVEYVGQYVYDEDVCDEPTAWGEDVDEDGNPIVTATKHGKHRIYTRKDGKLTDSEWVGGDDKVLPLLNVMDSVFSREENFQVPINNRTPIDDYIYKREVVPFESSYTLELAANMDEEIYGGLADPVKIVFKLNPETGVITLTASLINDPAYASMEAVLTPNRNLSDSFGLRIIDVLSDDGDTVRPVYETEGVTWKLDHISRNSK